MANFENKILREKPLGKAAKLKISQNEMSGRIFVEFSSMVNRGEGLAAE